MKGIKIFLIFLALGLAFAFVSQNATATNGICGETIPCECGDTLTASRTFDSRDNLEKCDFSDATKRTSALTFGSNNLVLDCKGKTISAYDCESPFLPDQNACYAGINAKNRLGAEIKNCKINGIRDAKFDKGIYVGTKTTVKDSEVKNARNGIEVNSYAYDCVLQNINIKNVDAKGDGIYFGGGSYGCEVDTVVIEDGYHGIGFDPYGSRSYDHTFNNIQIYNSDWVGIYLSRVDGLYFKNILVKGSRNVGVSVQGSRHKFEEIVIRDTNTRFQKLALAISGSNNEFKNGLIINNDVGIYIGDEYTSNQKRNTIDNFLIKDNSQVGILIDESDENIIKNTEIVNSGVRDLQITESNGNSFTDGLIFNDKSNIITLSDAYDNTISNNEFYYCEQSIEYSKGSTKGNNIIEDNTEHEICDAKDYYFMKIGEVITLCGKDGECYTDGTRRGCHAYDRSNGYYENDCENKIVYAENRLDGVYCNGDSDNCWQQNSGSSGIGSYLKCDHEELINNEEKCTNQPGCSWGSSSEVIFVELDKVNEEDMVLKDKEGDIHTVGTNTVTIGDLKAKGIAFIPGREAVIVQLNAECEEASDEQEYQEGDAFYNPCGSEWSREDCSEENPDWIWHFVDLTSEEPKLFARNSYDVTDDTANPIVEEECYDYPCSEYKLCFDKLQSKTHGLSIVPRGYAEYIIKYEFDTDLSNAINKQDNRLVSEPTIHIYAPEGPIYGMLRLESDNIEGLDGDTITDTSDIWLHIDKDDSNKISVYYERRLTGDPEEEGIFTYAGYIDTTNEGTTDGGISDLNFGRVFWRNTNHVNIELDLSGETATANSLDLNLDVVSDWSQQNEACGAYIGDGLDDITIALGHSTTEFSSIGDTQGFAESDELIWAEQEEDEAEGMPIGQKDVDLRTRYGTIIQNPQSYGSSDEVSLLIPFDQVVAKMSLRDANDEVLNECEHALGEGMNFGIGYEDTESAYSWEISFGRTPVVQTSLTSQDDDYESGIYVEVADAHLNYIATKDGALQKEDNFEFLGKELTLTDFDETGITVDGEQECSGGGAGPSFAPASGLTLTGTGIGAVFAIFIAGFGYWHYTNKPHHKRRKWRK